MIGTLVYSHQAQQGVLKDIQSEETKIRNFQILILLGFSFSLIACQQNEEIGLSLIHI